MIDYSRILRFIKNEYKEAAILILVDYHYYLSLYGQPTSARCCITIINMVNDNPHTMEYVDWNTLHNWNPFYIMDRHVVFGTTYATRFKVSQTNSQLLRDHLITYYPSLVADTTCIHLLRDNP